MFYNPTEKNRNTVVFQGMGVAKTGMDQLFFNIPISGFTYTLTQNPPFPKSPKSPTKSTQNPTSLIQHPLSYPIS